MTQSSPAVFGGISAAALRQYVDQIERIEAEIKLLNADKSEYYKAAKQAGADVHVLKWIIAERRKDPEERQVRGDLFKTYWEALETAEPRAITRTRGDDLEQLELEAAIAAAEAAE